MNKEQLRNERPDHKAQATYFVDTDGRAWQLFGATDTVILAHECYFEGGKLWSAPLAQLPFDRFGQWIDREQITEGDNGCVYVIQPVVKPKTTHRTVNTSELPAIIAAMQGLVRYAIQKETGNTVSIIVLAEDSEALTAAIDSLYSYDNEETTEDLQLAGDDEQGWSDALYGLFQAGRE